MDLKQLKINQSGIVKEINCKPNVKRRLMDIGLIKGTKVKKIRLAPLGDPMVIEVRDFQLAIRKSDAELILLDD